MLIQDFQTNSAIQTLDKNALAELEIFQNILKSVDTGIALVDKDYTLLYCNPVFTRLLNNARAPKLGKKVYLRKDLQLAQLEEIHQELLENDFWQGIFPEIGKGLKVVVSRINFSIPTFITSLSNAYFMLVVSDHSQILEQQQELTNAKYLAVKSEKAKAELLSHMSHELRTPLNAIQGFTQLLQMEPTLSDEQKDFLGEIMSASKYLLNLTNEILSLSKTEHDYGKLKFSDESINVQELITECISLVKPLSQKARIQLVQKDSDTRLVKDRVRLKQIIINLLSNAVKYNTDGGQVVIHSFSVSDTSVRIEVQDSGNGIPGQLLSTIFSPFERLGATNSKIEGSGIGLMITRRLVNLMDGAISVVSEPGRGSIFSVNFPVTSSTIGIQNKLLLEKPRKIVWIGNNSKEQLFAKRLLELRPNSEFQQIKSLSTLDTKRLNSDTDVVLLNVADYVSLLSSPSHDIKGFIQEFSTIAVISKSSSPEAQIDCSLKFTDYLSTAFNAIDFMEIIDHPSRR